jgi:hypothetical protein
MKKERLREALPGYGTTGHLTSALLAHRQGRSTSSPIAARRPR